MLLRFHRQQEHDDRRTSSPMPMRDQVLEPAERGVTLPTSVIAAASLRGRGRWSSGTTRVRGPTAPTVGDRELDCRSDFVNGRSATPGQGTTLEDSGTTVTPRPPHPCDIAPPVSPCSTTAGEAELWIARGTHRRGGETARATRELKHLVRGASQYRPPPYAPAVIGYRHHEGHSESFLISTVPSCPNDGRSRRRGSCPVPLDDGGVVIDRGGSAPRKPAP